NTSPFEDASGSDKFAERDRDTVARLVGGPCGRRSPGRPAVFHHALQPLSRNATSVNKIGPSLVGVVGRKSGSEPGYNYSPALKAANITWDQKTLDQWLQNPTGDVHGSKMFITVPNAEDRQNVIAYLETLK